MNTELERELQMLGVLPLDVVTPEDDDRYEDIRYVHLAKGYFNTEYTGDNGEILF